MSVQTKRSNLHLLYVGTVFAVRSQWEDAYKFSDIVFNKYFLRKTFLDYFSIEAIVKSTLGYRIDTG